MAEVPKVSVSFGISKLPVSSIGDVYGGKSIVPPRKDQVLADYSYLARKAVKINKFWENTFVRWGIYRKK